MSIPDEDNDRCYECGGYGDEYYWDEELQEYVRRCDECPWNGREVDDE